LSGIACPEVASHDVRVDAAELGHRIRRARERRRWTQAQLAETLGVGVRSVGRWERGEVVPRSTIGALEQVLGIGLDGTDVDLAEEAIRDLGTDRGGPLELADVERLLEFYRTGQPPPAARAG